MARNSTSYIETQCKISYEQNLFYMMGCVNFFQNEPSVFDHLILFYEVLNISREILLITIDLFVDPKLDISLFFNFLLHVYRDELNT